MFWNLYPTPDTLQEQLDLANDYGLDGIILSLYKGDEKPRLYASGWHNIETQTPAYPEAYFKIASVNKLFIALAMVKLSAEGRVDLDQSLSVFFPDLKGKIQNLEDITVKHLIQHRSGIPNITDTPNYWVDPPTNQQNALARIFDLPADFNPGDQYAYSNTNYLLLEMILEKVLKGSYPDYIRSEILSALNLNAIYFSKSDISSDSLMSGYYVNVEGDIKSANYGSMVATASDLSKFLFLLNNGSIFQSPEEAALYHSLYPSEHTGLIPGYQTIARYNKATETAIVQFVNTTNFEGDTWAMGELMYKKIIQILEAQENKLNN
jgi:CubicO group peptidase (beta-lactamase class C family)